jgi:hypothetical protein
MSDRTYRDDGDAVPAQRPLTEGEKDSVKTAGPPATAAAGALAGAAAGISTLVFGPIGLVVGAIAGGAAGAAVGAASSQAAAGDYYSAEYDDYYRGLWESSPRRAADRTFDSARAGYQFGHVAAQYPEFAGRDFHDVEPELQRRWSDDLRAHGGDWEAVRPDVETAYGYARSRGLGVRRDSTVVGSAGSAVDPVELEQSRRL